jgi:dienelactone hydrolase
MTTVNSRMFGVAGLTSLALMTQALSAQTAATGTWQLDAPQGSPSFSMFLRTDGATLSGLVSRCATGQSQRAEIHDGRVTGETVTFKCTSPDGDRTVSFTGRVAGDEIAISWERSVRPGGLDNTAVDRIFGATAPRQFVVKRIPDGELAKAADEARGMELAAAVNLRAQDVKAEGILFLPVKVAQVRAVIVTLDYGLGHAIYDAPEWRKLTEKIGAALLRVRFSNIGPPVRQGPFLGSAIDDALVNLLQRLGQETNQPDFANAPLILWGHSGGGGMVSAYAARHPERILAFVRYHSGPATGDLEVVSKIPSLFLAGGRDTTAPVAVAEKLWRSGRVLGAPWTFAVEPEAVHGDAKDLAKANALMTRWVEAVVRHRLSSDGAVLRPVTDKVGWVDESSWLPDEASAQAWRELTSAVK